MAGTGAVEQAVEETEPDQQPGGTARRLHLGDRVNERQVELRLHRRHPQEEALEDTVLGRRRRVRNRHTERRVRGQAGQRQQQQDCHRGG